VRDAQAKNLEMHRRMDERSKYPAILSPTTGGVGTREGEELGMAASDMNDISSTRLARMNAAKLKAQTDHSNSNSHADRWNSRSSRNTANIIQGQTGQSQRYDDYPVMRESSEGVLDDTGETGYAYAGVSSAAGAVGHSAPTTGSSSWATVHEDGTRSYLNGWFGLDTPLSTTTSSKSSSTKHHRIGTSRYLTRDGLHDDEDWESKIDDEEYGGNGGNVTGDTSFGISQAYHGV